MTRPPSHPPGPDGEPPSEPLSGDLPGEATTKRSKVTRRELFVLGAATAVSALSGAVAVTWQRDRTGARPATAVTPPSPEPAAEPVPSPAAASPDASSAPDPSTVPDAGDAAAAEESPAEAPPAAATVISALCRASWGAAPAAAGTPHTIQQITVHHSGEVLRDNRHVPSRIRRFQQLHQAKGWSDIAYHYVIDAEGSIYEARLVDVAGDTATDYDPRGHFLALCDGNFEEQDIPERQLDALARLLAWAVQRYGLSVEQISGHKDHAATACPGEALYARLRNGDLASRVSGYLAAGPWELALVCGPEAFARVRAIEAGRG